MRSIASMGALLTIFWLKALVGASTLPPGGISVTRGPAMPATICLHHRASTGIADISMAPVYDWVHAGQQGIDLSITNKTNEKMEIYWDRSSYQRHAAGEVARDKDISAMEANSSELHDTIAPGATFSRTLWPRSKAGRLENQSIYLALAGAKGSEEREEVILDVRGDNRICSR